MGRQRYAAVSAVVFTSLAVAFYSADPAFNVQNVLMGLAALVAIATIFVPRLRHGQRSKPQTEAVHHIKGT
jgi:hypothetical protein